jgi:hypothetical protein
MHYFVVNRNAQTMSILDGLWLTTFECGPCPLSQGQLFCQPVELEAGHAWLRRSDQLIECFRYNLIRPAHQGNFFRVFERYHLMPQVDSVNVQGRQDSVLNLFRPAYPVDLREKPGTSIVIEQRASR